MRICREGLDDRLASVVKFEPFIAGESYLWVIHPNDTKRWINDELPERLSDVHCRGILLVKGVPRAGISEELFLSLKNQYGTRFHISAQAVGTTQEDSRLTRLNAARFARFFEHARSRDVLNWDILDPPWPQSLVAAYLLARVMSADLQTGVAIEGNRTDWEPIWIEAGKEYTALTGHTMTSARLDNTTAAEIAEEMGEQVEKITSQIPCDAAQKRGILRHSWLENQVLPVSEEFLILMRKSGTLVKARKSFERMIEPRGQFSDYCNLANQLVLGMVDGFSPACLVDDGPLAILPTPLSEVIKSALHSQYLEQSRIEEHSVPISNAIKNVKKALGRFSRLWFQQPKVDDQSIKSAFAAVQATAAGLQKQLGTLPEGFVLK
jgi:hypothetical protein